MILNQYTISGENFKRVHKAACDLNQIASRLEGILNEDMSKRLHNAIKELYAGLAEAHEQDHNAFDARSKHFEEVGFEEGFTTNWSMYEVTNLDEPHPWPSAERVVYDGHWGDTAPNVDLKSMGNTWRDLWAAADYAINQSGDRHHVFIEGFRPTNGGKDLELLTGS